MIMKMEPILKAYESLDSKKSRVIFPTPDGKMFNQNIANELSKEKKLVFICGHYKGIDQRVRNEIVTDEISIGDYVLSNGELPALIMIDSIMRLVPGVLNDYKSAKTDSFSSDLLDGPHYTRPREYCGLKVPDVLLSGNHKEIENWFLKERINKTKKIEWIYIKNINPKIVEKKMNKILESTKDLMKNDIPVFKSGDTLAVGVKVIEGEKSRIQMFEGVVIAISSGSGLAKTFTLRKVSNGVGVERVFPMHSPNLDSIKVVKKGKVRRAKLYYLRGRQGKAAKIKEIIS